LVAQINKSGGDSQWGTFVVIKKSSYKKLVDENCKLKEQNTILVEKVTRLRNALTEARFLQGKKSNESN